MRKIDYPGGGIYFIKHKNELEILHGGFQKEMKVQHPFRNNKTS